jgi:hypothetical protein
VAIPATNHRADQSVSPQPSEVVVADARAALVGTVQQTDVRAATLERHGERPQREMPVVHGTQRPTHDEARVEIEDGGEIQLGCRRRRTRSWH